LNNKIFGAILSAFLIAISFAGNVHPVLAYAPQAGDSFNYSETIIVNNGQGSYTGYTDQTQVTGMGRMNSVSGTDVLASYSFSSQFSSNQGQSFTNSSSGNYVWSSSNYTYVNGTDNQVGYSKPIYVWFAMSTSLPVGATFYVLNTQFTVMSKNVSLQLPTEGNKWVQTIQAQGTGQHQRVDSYGTFTASYTWTEYFDPTTGYIVGYTYVEQDNGQYQGQAGSFTYTDTLDVTSTSYSLALANPGSTNTGPGLELFGLDPYLVSLVLLFVVIIIAVAVYAATRRKRKDTLPPHPYGASPPPSPPSTPWESKIDLGSNPPPQVVIRDVAKVNCRYCGTLIPTTVDHCPYCGGPRQ
jgi:hypothetical protein